jgi:hypothetical protein
MIYRFIILLIILCAALTACAAPERVTIGVLLPEGYRENFVQYARVDREDATIRELYVHPDTLEQVRAGRVLADGTIIVIEAYHAQIDDQGEPILDSEARFVKGIPIEKVHVIEKRPDWTAADFTSDTRTTGAGNWNFGSYQFDSNARFDEDLNACFHCHNATPETDFVYTYPLLLTFARTGEVQYFYCDIAGRIACEL